MQPLKFKEITKSPLWAGQDIVALKHYPVGTPAVGESWEISGVRGDETRVVGGPYDGKTLPELIATLGADLVGRRNLERYGTDFPLLVKFISAAGDLSIQVHPDDALAQVLEGKRFGKTEMWYIVKAAEGATLYSGFKHDLTLETYDAVMAEGRLTEVMARHETHAGDCYFIPAGQIHSIGAGNLLIEVQQTSDITYRVYDFDRVGADGRKRQLHTEQARKALNFKAKKEYRTAYDDRENVRILLEQHPEFTTSVYHLTSPLTTDFSTTDSFVIFVAYEGTARLRDDEGNVVVLRAGESVLYPATMRSVTFEPVGTERFSCIETFVD